MTEEINILSMKGLQQIKLVSRYMFRFIVLAETISIVFYTFYTWWYYREKDVETVQGQTNTLQ